jgi:outer membrane protein TolC
MKKLVVLALLYGAPASAGAEPLTFEEALKLVRAAAPSPTTTFDAELAGLRRSRLPSVRAEVIGNSSQTLDFFSEGPITVHYATTALAFDYPLWDGGLMRARTSALETRLRAFANRDGVDEVRFTQLLDAFGELYLTQRLTEMQRPVVEQLTNEANRSEELLAAGDISNLMATERREIALAMQSRLLEIEARRVDAAARLRLLTGLTEEPQVVLDATPAVGEPATFVDERVKALDAAIEDSRSRLRQLGLANAFTAMLSGFAGIGTAQSTFRDVDSSGSHGVYGLRIHLSYPLFRGVSALPILEARADLEHNLALRDAALREAQARVSTYRVREETARKRIELLQQSVDAGKQREESLRRLVAGGVRTESDVAQAQAERVRREGDLLAAQVEQWKAARVLSRMTTP